MRLGKCLGCCKSDTDDDLPLPPGFGKVQKNVYKEVKSFRSFLGGSHLRQTMYSVILGV